jgi:hypothetical protein
MAQNRPLVRSSEGAGSQLLREAEARLMELAGFGPDWDSYGGDPPTALAITGARSLLARVVEAFGSEYSAVMRPFAIAPIADGGVLVEWRVPGRLLSVLVGPEGNLGFLAAEGEPGARQYQKADDVSGEAILERVGRMLRHAAGE